jgi:phenylacetate-coenzyme A ligase PaaK-like adenylate-forming protein
MTPLNPGRVSSGFRACRLPGSGRRRILDFQNRQLRGQVAWAYERIPYYRELFDRARIRPGDLRTAADLQSLPPTSKSELLERPLEERLARIWDPGRLIRNTTTGSTGQPFAIWRSPADEFFHFAVRLRVMRYYGLRPADLMARISAAGPEGMPKPWRLAQRAGLYRAHLIHILAPPSGSPGSSATSSRMS